MIGSIKQISEGAPFMADFTKVAVQRCHYINATDERVEQMSFLDQATATILRVSDKGTIFIQLVDHGVERPLVHFKAKTAFYNKSEHSEVSQTSMLRGDEIVEELPISFNELEHGKVNLFSISKQNGETIAFLIINPANVDDYYYRIMFREN